MTFNFSIRIKSTVFFCCVNYSCAQPFTSTFLINNYSLAMALFEVSSIVENISRNNLVQFILNVRLNLHRLTRTCLWRSSFKGSTDVWSQVACDLHHLDLTPASCDFQNYWDKRACGTRERLLRFAMRAIETNIHNLFFYWFFECTHAMLLEK